MKSILCLNTKARKKVLKALGFSPNLKEELGLDFENLDTKERIVGAYKEYMEESAFTT